MEEGNQSNLTTVNSVKETVKIDIAHFPHSAHELNFTYKKNTFNISTVKVDVFSVQSKSRGFSKGCSYLKPGEHTII